MNMKICENIRNRRKEMGLTQKGLAELSGVPTITIQNYERGIRQPWIDNLQKYQEY